MDYNRQMPWTKEEDDLLLKMRAQGMTFADIGRKLNKDHRRVWYRLNHVLTRDCQRVSRWTPEEDAIISSVRAEGKAWKEAAMRLGPHRTAYAVRNRYYKVMQKRKTSSPAAEQSIGSPARPVLCSPSVTLASIGGRRGYATKGAPYTPRTMKSWTQEEDDTVQRMWKEGFSKTAIATELKRSVSSVNHRFHRLSRLSRGTSTVRLQRFFPEDDDKLVHLRDSGMTWYDVPGSDLVA